MRGRVVVVSVVLGILAVSCSGGDGTSEEQPGTEEESGGDSSDQPTDSDERPSADVEADKAAAEAALLTLADFPAGWSETPPDDDDENELGREVAKCLGGTGDSFIDVGDAEAETGDFTNPDDDGTVSESVGIAATLEEAELLVAALNGADVPTCLQDVYRDFLQDLIDNPPTPADALPEGVTLGETTVGRLNVTPVGDETTALRVTVPMTLEGGLTIDVVVDLVLVRRGRALAGLSFQSTFTPFDIEDIDLYSGLAAERLPAD